jgi:hypothetical protein
MEIAMASYVPGFVSNFFSETFLPTAYKFLPFSSKQSSMFLDPVDVITGLAILALYRKTGEEGIKLSIVDNRVRRDHSYGLLQGIKRSLDGTHHEQLHDLTAPMFHAIVWFTPHKNKQFLTLFRLAMEGVQALMETYEKDGNKFTVEYLHAAHYKLLEDGLAGKEMNIKDRKIPCWDKKPLAQRALLLWKKNECERLCQINSLFETALVHGSTDLIKSYPIKPLVEIIKTRVDDIVMELLKYKDTLVSLEEEGSEEPASAATSQ